MTMEDWAKRLDAFLEFDDRKVLEDAGKITAKLANQYAESEFEKFRPKQDLGYCSDFDKEVKKLQSRKKGC